MKETTLTVITIDQFEDYAITGEEKMPELGPRNGFTAAPALIEFMRRFYDDEPDSMLELWLRHSRTHPERVHHLLEVDCPKQQIILYPLYAALHKKLKGEYPPCNVMEEEVAEDVLQELNNPGALDE